MDWKAVLDVLAPSEGKAYSRQWYVWVGFGILSFWVFFWWSIGLMPSAFGEGFARAEETRFNTQILLEQRLISVKQHQCLANDSESRVYWTSELNRLRALYKKRVGTEHYEPSCTAIVGANAGTD